MFRGFLGLLLSGVLLSVSPWDSLGRDAPGNRDCPQSFAGLRRSFGQFQGEVREYWQWNYAHFLPSRYLSPTDRIISGAIQLVKDGIKVAISPSIIAFDLLRSPFRAAREIRRNGQSYHRLLFIPLDIAQRNGTHLTAYAGLTATGYHAANFFLDRHTFIENMEPVPANMPPLREDEIIVLIYPITDQGFADPMFNFISVEYRLRGVPEEKIFRIRPISIADVFQQLGGLRRLGRIRDIHWLAHGSPGSMSLDEGRSTSMETLDLNRLSEIVPLVENWPRDLISENARLNLLSCSLGNGESGRTFIRSLGMLTLQGEGTVVAPSRTMSANPQLRGYISRRVIGNLTSIPGASNRDPLEILETHSLFVPVLYSATLFHALYEIGNAAAPLPVEVIHLNR